MVRFLKRHFGLFLLAILALGATFAFTRPTPPPTVALVSVEQAPLVRALALNGRVRAFDVADVKPRRAGRLAEILVSEGDSVKAGDVLARIDAPQLNFSVKGLQADLERARANAAQAVRDVSRIKKLNVDGYATIAQLEAEKLKQSLAEKDIQSAKADLERAQADDADAVILAPYDAVVQKIPVDIGSTVALDTSVFTLARTGPQDIEAEADEIYAPALKLGQEVAITTPNLSEPLSAKITWLAPNIDTRSGGLLLRVSGDGIDKLPPGLSVSLTVTVANVDKGLILPRDAVLSPQFDPSVLAYDSSTQTLVSKPIKVVDWPADKIQVIGGLELGDKVAAAPRGMIAGTKIIPKEKLDKTDK